MRSGLWVSGAGGSGVVVARKSDGSWSEPTGILLHTAGLGFLVGVDIYDCVLVLNTQKAVDAFTRLRFTLGGELSVVAGPVGMGAYMETEIHTRQAPIFQYIKSRGFYAGVQVDGTVIIERNDENERFYLEKISAVDILAGKARHPPFELEMLKETLLAAQGDTFDMSKAAPSGPAPSDLEVEEPGHIFGVPDKEDPDPFGLLALKASGLELKDAATHEPAHKDELEQEFVFQPSAQSPIFATYHHRRSTSAGLASMDVAQPVDGVRRASAMPLNRGPPPPLPRRAVAEGAAMDQDQPIVMTDAEQHETSTLDQVDESATDISKQKQFEAIQQLIPEAHAETNAIQHPVLDHGSAPEHDDDSKTDTLVYKAVATEPEEVDEIAHHDYDNEIEKHAPNDEATPGEYEDTTETMPGSFN